MTLTRVGFIPLPTGKEPAFDHADLETGSLKLWTLMSLIQERTEIIDCLTNSWGMPR